MSDENKPDEQQRTHEQEQERAAYAISPRAARHGWTVEECRVFAEWDGGGE